MKLLTLIPGWIHPARVNTQVVLRDGGGCNDMGRLRWEERECLLPWVCAGQIRGGQALLSSESRGVQC